MVQRNNNIPTWQITNAWREILARIFEDIETRINVSPEWLVNPVTNRRLKLDLLYPEIGVAIRFEGLQGKQRRQRPSLEEEAQQRIRDEARADVCRSHGFELVVIDLTGNDPKRTILNLDLALSRAQERGEDDVIVLKVREARATAAGLARRIKQPADFKLYAELWEDRQYHMTAPLKTTTPTSSLPAFTVGMAVDHIIFGRGVIRAVTPSGDDTLLTVDFGGEKQKVLMASLVADKLFPYNQD
jgi:hypothetical protein